MRQSTIIFYGGAGSVTGSNFMVDTGGAKFLIDCGLQQGIHEEQNWQPFAYDPAEVSHLIITHAHIDHIGRIPRLVAAGFKGKILSTHATQALVGPLLRDAMAVSALHHEHDRLGPLYEEKDIEAALKLWHPIGYHEKVELPDGVTLELYNSGHILGSAMAKLTREGKALVITGDLGGGNSPLLGPAEDLGNVDYLVMESVYGDRTREDSDRRGALENIIEDTAARGGTILIPAFSTERTQELLFEIRALMLEKRVPALPVYVDSPLAEKITTAFMAQPEYFAPDIRARIEGGENIFMFEGMHFAEDTEESRKVAALPGPKIVLAGSGMSTGGRVLLHERYVLPDPNSTLLIVGYQAAGSIGRRLVEGEKELHIAHESIPVKAKIESIYGYSAHMDGQDLVEFANKAARTAKQVFVVEGEPAASSFLAQRIRDYLGVKAVTPEAGSSEKIDL